MHEALEEFSREAEWSMSLGGFGPDQIPSSTYWTVNLPVDTSKLNRTILCAGNISCFETPHRYEGHGYKEELEKIADKVREVGMSIQRLRFMGYDYLWTRKRLPHRPLSDKQIPNMIRNLKKSFKDADVGRWEMSVVSPRNRDLWFLLEIELDGSLKVLVDKSVGHWT